MAEMGPVVAGIGEGWWPKTQSQAPFLPQSFRFRGGYWDTRSQGLASEIAAPTPSRPDPMGRFFKRPKVKVEAYVGTLEWAKLHAAFANRGKTPAAK